jgi:ATP-dependent Lhr-like helicase
VLQTVRDCLEEAMDLPQLTGILERIHRGEIACVGRDTPEPSPLSHEIVNARPYAFLDDAPLEERRTQAVYARRATAPATGGDLGALDPDAITRVVAEAWPDPRDAEELHDTLLSLGVMTGPEAERAGWESWLADLAAGRRAARAIAPAWPEPLWIAAERLPEIAAVCPSVRTSPPIEAPAARAARAWSREEATLELLRGRLAVSGPTTAPACAAPLGLTGSEADAALVALESEGVVLRGSFTLGARDREWCDRRLLARIHRLTLNRLRAEIEPVTPADFMRFLFAWQHVSPGHQLAGVDGLRTVLGQLDGYETAAGTWERTVLPARVRDYTPSMLDQLCFAGEVAWGRLTPAGATRAGRKLARPVRSMPVALFPRAHAGAWLALERDADYPARSAGSAPGCSDRAAHVLDHLRQRGASFEHELASPQVTGPDVRRALQELAAAGLVTSDGFGGLRAMLSPRGGREARAGRSAPGARAAALRASAGGRWSLLDRGSPVESPAGRDVALELRARVLLQRYGVVFRRLLAREPQTTPWRELVAVYRRLEARGEIRGGRFVLGMSGEQFALPDAITALREVRHSPPSRAILAIGGADPLNLTGIVTGDERIAALGATRIAYRDGLALAVMEGDYVRPLNDYEPEAVGAVASALAGRRVPAVASGFLGRVDARA